jgi:hypothetical protein
MTRAWVVVGAVGACLLAGAALHAQQHAGSTPILTDQDRADIQKLSAGYAVSLGTCKGEEWADLFAPDGGFASGTRGMVRGRQRLIALVASERQCNDGGEPRPRAVPTAVIQPAPGGATGTAPSNLGHYEDVYVKTPAGWRFKSRQVVTAQETAAQLTAKDFDEIRRMAGDGLGLFGDLWLKTPNGWRFKSSGLIIDAAGPKKTGTAYLKSGGHYEDVYVKASGGWRFESRTYVSAEQESATVAANSRRIE